MQSEEPIQETEEVERRRWAVRNAIASVRIEGLEPGEDFVDDMERFAQGELSLEEIRDSILAKYRRK